MLQFGLSAVQGGKRVIAGNNEPTLIANSGKAKFTLAAPVTRIMGLMPGDSIQFISTVAAIDAAIAERDADVVAWCESAGVEFGTEAARAALLEEFAEYYIAKGIALYEKDGSPKLATIRMTAEEKAIKNREAVKKCMKNKDRINVILPQGTIDRINSYGLKTSSFARELILSELDKMDRMKK